MKYRSVSIRILFALSIFAVGMVSAESGGCATEVVVIPVQHRSAAELVPVVERLLSPEGRVSHDARTNSLIIIDRSEHLRNIRVALNRTDPPMEQVNVRVRFHRAKSERERGGSVEGRVSGEHGSVGIGSGRKEGLHLEVRDDRSRDAVRSEYVIRVASGSSAYILAARDIPFRARWRTLCGKYAECPAAAGFRRIETGFEVTPVIRGDRAEIEIVPRISGAGSSGNADIIRFTEAATRLTAPVGRWATLGGWEEAEEAVVDSILESASRNREERLSMSLRVEPVD